jgi:hypothetical protein
VRRREQAAQVGVVGLVEQRVELRVEHPEQQALLAGETQPVVAVCAPLERATLEHG